ncbi:MAG: glycoside hydrolase family 9 protein [Ruminococcus sp.]
MRKHLRLTAALTAGCLVLGALPCSALTVSAADFSANYAEAMQKSLYFYECQQAGPLPDWNEVEWRADSTMTDEVTGGWYDAGDHVKFNLPMAYSASMLAWGTVPGRSGKDRRNGTYVNNLSFVLDYLAACDEGDTAVYQVGTAMDHTWWGSVSRGIRHEGQRR